MLYVWNLLVPFQISVSVFILLKKCLSLSNSYTGGHIKTVFNMRSVPDCQFQCQRETHCTLFSYNTVSQKCYLKKQHANLKEIGTSDEDGAPDEHEYGRRNSSDDEIPIQNHQVSLGKRES